MRPYFSAPINRDRCLSQGSFACNRRLEHNCVKLAQKRELVVRIEETFNLRKLMFRRYKQFRKLT